MRKEKKEDSLNKRRNVPDVDYEDDFENEDGRVRPNLADIVENAKSSDTDIQLKAIQGMFSQFLVNSSELA